MEEPGRRLRSLLALVDGLPGDTAECGVWTGTSSWFIFEHFVGSGKVHFGFDTFEGLSKPSAATAATGGGSDTEGFRSIAARGMDPRAIR